MYLLGAFVKLALKGLETSSPFYRIGPAMFAENVTLLTAARRAPIRDKMLGKQSSYVLEEG